MSMGPLMLLSFFQSWPPRKPAIVCLQETNFDRTQRKSWLSLLQKQGYRAWTSKVNERTNSLGHDVHFGGLAVAVRQDIAAQFVSEWTGDEGQLLTILLENLCITCIWRRPQNESESFVQTLTEHRMSYHPLPWIGLGDWNWTPEDNEAIGLGTLLPVVDHEGTPIPTRWHATRAVDYAVTSQTNLGSSPELDSHVLGDHKIYKLRINLPQVGKNPTTIRPVTRFLCPQHLSTHQWRKTLQNVFKDIQCPLISNTETEWKHLLCTSHPKVATSLCPNHKYEPSSRAIGSLPQAIPMNAKKPSHTSFRSRRLAKFLGRLREWQRQQNKNHPTASLWKRIQKAWPAGIPISPNIQETESLVEQELAAELNLLGKARLRNWRHRMNTNNQATTQWLLNQQTPLPPEIWVSQPTENYPIGVKSRDLPRKSTSHSNLLGKILE